MLLFILVSTALEPLVDMNPVTKGAQVALVPPSQDQSLVMYTNHYTIKALFWHVVRRKMLIFMVRGY